MTCKATKRGANIARITQIVVYHYGTVYGLDADYVLDNGRILNCAHGKPHFPELVRDVISISGTCIY